MAKKKEVWLMYFPENDDNVSPELYAVFSTLRKAELYRDAFFDPKGDIPKIVWLVLDPKPVGREFVTVWHTCLDTETGHFGNKGKSARYLATDPEAEDRVMFVPRKYANVYSRVSAEDSIRRAQQWENWYRYRDENTYTDYETRAEAVAAKKAQNGGEVFRPWKKKA